LRILDRSSAENLVAAMVHETTADVSGVILLTGMAALSTKRLAVRHWLAGIVTRLGRGSWQQEAGHVVT
ncbi:hypothetical protein, partial [Stenotrophomonas maltophilia]|uniref:hypothetical protein n=1 Tax=Stenotrophomonas maltophilia TaxID=40324 RepID=UPI0019533D30